VLDALFLAAALDYTRHSLNATYRHYTEPGAEIIERTDANGTARTVYPLPIVRRVIVRAPRPVARELDPHTGVLLREVPQFFHAKGRVFEVNPVAKLNAPELHDQNDAASAVPTAAYSEVDLLGLAATGTLTGPYVNIVDAQHPNTPRADVAQSLLFDRGQPQFEEVNVYHQIDATQRYLQSLGYTGARAIAAYPIAVDPHALNGTDNSVFEVSSVPGRGVLFFGDGGTDDAEDADIVIHEYMHAIHEWIAPGALFGTSASEARALAEGYADFWAFSRTRAENLSSGFDPYCIGEWDARCNGDDPSQLCGYPPGATCLRRVDSVKTMADFKRVERAGQEHENGAIWSSLLREVYEGLEKRDDAADKLIVESLFGMPTNPTFAIAGRQLYDAVRPTLNDDIVCRALNRRGILIAECDRTPRGDTLFHSSTDTIVIDDPRLIERLVVVTDIEAMLSEPSISIVSPHGIAAGIRGTEIFRGRTAAGAWRIHVLGGKLRSWSLAIQFAGDAPLATRPTSSGPRKHIAAVAHAPGQNGTEWITDVRLFNAGSTPANVTVVYTPDSGHFGAVKIFIKPKQVIALHDVVGDLMQTFGLGSLEFQGDVVNLVVTSRTYTSNARGTFGQFIPGADNAAAIGAGTTAYATHLRSDGEFRANVGFTEVAGGAGIVRVAGKDFAIAPYQHVQMPAGGDTDFTVISGSARILAYGALIDNRSGDAIYVPARVPPNAARVEYAPAISATGALGTRWATEVAVTHPFTAHFGGAAASGAAKRYANVLTELFARDNVLGLLAIDLPAGSLATARIWTPSDGGTYGQFVPFAAAPHGGELLQLEVSDNFRTNAGAANTGAEPAPVRFTYFNAEGVPLDTFQRTLRPGELLQFPLQVNAARVRVDGAVLAWASVIDNRSGDAIFVPAQ
jgi:zinc metalloprotease ZmpB